MEDVKTKFMFQRTRDRYAQEVSIWTTETSYVYYPLSYSLRDCLELICEKLGWKYMQYEIFGSINGLLHAMKPAPKRMTTLDWWDKANSTSKSYIVYYYSASG